MPNIALVTGASSGIGREIAIYHAQRGGDVVIVARREEALEALKREIEDGHGVSVHIVPLDLGTPDAAQDLYDRVTSAGLQVDILINNAGFGGHGEFVTRPLDDDLGMIDLNVRTLVALCHLFGADMAQRGKGRILNVSSTAAHMPGPLQATYFATKAFVSSFSQAIDHELRPRGVTVTALEPGYVETEFAARADLDGTDLVKSGATPREVAKIGYDAMMEGRLTVINDGKLNFALNWLLPWMPRRTKLKFVRRMQEKRS